MNGMASRYLKIASGCGDAHVQRIAMRDHARERAVASGHHVLGAHDVPVERDARTIDQEQTADGVAKVSGGDVSMKRRAKAGVGSDLHAVERAALAHLRQSFDQLGDQLRTGRSGLVRVAEQRAEHRGLHRIRVDAVGERRVEKVGVLFAQQHDAAAAVSRTIQRRSRRVDRRTRSAAAARDQRERGGEREGERRVSCGARAHSSCLRKRRTLNAK